MSIKFPGGKQIKTYTQFYLFDWNGTNESILVYPCFDQDICYDKYGQLTKLDGRDDHIKEVLYHRVKNILNDGLLKGGQTNFMINAINESTKKVINHELIPTEDKASLIQSLSKSSYIKEKFLNPHDFRVWMRTGRFSTSVFVYGFGSSANHNDEFYIMTHHGSNSIAHYIHGGTEFSNLHEKP